MKERIHNRKVVENLIASQELYELAVKLSKDAVRSHPILLLTLYNGSLDLVISSMVIWHRDHGRRDVKRSGSKPSIDESIGDLPAIWSILDSTFKKDFKRPLPNGRQMMELKEDLKEVLGGGEVPDQDGIDQLHTSLGTLLEDVSVALLQTHLGDLDRSLRIEHREVADVLHEGFLAFRSSEFQKSIRCSAIAFSLALESFRQEINELSRAGMLDPSLFLLDHPVPLHLRIAEKDILLLALGYDQELYEKFTSIIPTSVLKVDEGEEPRLVVSEFSTTTLASEENASFCLDFAAETVLKWEALEILASEERDPKDISL